MAMTLAAILFLLLLSAFFSGSETAMTAASRPMMHQLEQTGDARAGIVNRLLANKARFISAVLLGNNLVNILASALATSALIGLFGQNGVAYATIGMTILVLIFAEILPKTFAFRYANRTALGLARTVSVVVLVLTPFTQGIMWLVRGVFRAFGTDIHGDEALGAGDEELRGAIELHAGDDDAIRQERAMLRSVLDLNDVQVGEIMVHRRNLVAIDADTPPDEIVHQALASPYTRIPLWRGSIDNIVGVLHAKDLFKAVQAKGEALAVEDILEMAAAPWFVPEYAPLLDQLMAFRERREHFALVVDEYGDLMGVVTLEDILEEIVGEISDEHDITVSGVRPQPDGSFIVAGSVTLRDLNREFEWALPDEEAATIAGLVLHETQRIPEVGQSFLFHGFRFDILRRHRHQITQVRVTPPSQNDPE